MCVCVCVRVCVCERERESPGVREGGGNVEDDYYRHRDSGSAITQQLNLHSMS